MGYPKIVWDEKMLCGNAILDEQHRELSRQTNALIDLLDQHSPEEPVCRRAIDNLVKNIWTHFLKEEVLIGNLGKHDYDEHFQSHAKYYEQLTRLSKRPEDVAQLADLLIVGMTRHIQYGDFTSINDGIC